MNKNCKRILLFCLTAALLLLSASAETFAGAQDAAFADAQVVLLFTTCLLYTSLYALARKGFYDRARDAQHLMDCIECGACAYQCPARLPLVQYIRAAKGALRRAQAR